MIFFDGSDIEIRMRDRKTRESLFAARKDTPRAACIIKFSVQSDKGGRRRIGIPYAERAAFLRSEKTERLTDDGKRVLRTVDDDVDGIGGAGRDFIIEDGNARKRILRTIGFTSQLVDKKRKRRAQF